MLLTTSLLQAALAVAALLAGQRAQVAAGPTPATAPRSSCKYIFVRPDSPVLARLDFLLLLQGPDVMATDRLREALISTRHDSLPVVGWHTAFNQSTGSQVWLTVHEPSTPVLTHVEVAVEDAFGLKLTCQKITRKGEADPSPNVWPDYRIWGGNSTVTTEPTQAPRAE
ncbi:MAG: hypothetical protein M1832_000555 [Thelocarpon impressellum]|nr:MAG: hypothetical protein M1832_000555 [Thelocarpon impressellum]